jgi:hypothetical protein
MLYMAGYLLVTSQHTVHKVEFTLLQRADVPVVKVIHRGVGREKK